MIVLILFLSVSLLHQCLWLCRTRLRIDVSLVGYCQLYQDVTSVTFFGTNLCKKCQIFLIVPLLFKTTIVYYCLMFTKQEWT